jgi:isopenicillin N synthase-like dioxygenase
VFEKYTSAVLSFAMEVVRAIAVGLGVDEKVLLSRVDKSFWNLRIIGYEAMNKKADVSKVSGIGEHTGRLSHGSLISRIWK